MRFQDVVRRQDLRLNGRMRRKQHYRHDGKGNDGQIATDV
jgi:hypothetical protein